MKAKVMSFFVLLSMVVTGLAFNYYVEQPVENQFGNVIAMSSDSTPITVETVSSPSDKTLVPEGALLGQNDVTALDYTYLITADEGQNLEVAVKDVVFLKDNLKFDDEYGLLVIEYSFETIRNNEVLLHVTMSLNMPENEVQYNSIAGHTLSFNLKLDRL